MLDTDTKRRIDNCRDILVGKVPDPKSQVEQITIALIYKFMDDMDAEAEELGGKRKFFFGTYEKYGWSKLMASNMGGVDILMLYSEAIQKMNENPGIPPLFRDIFKNAYLPYRDPETLRSFLKEINVFTYDHSEKLGDAFEYLLSVLGSQGDAGQFRTPRHIIEFIVDIIDPKKNETILDPACGTAGFLISAYKHILDANKKERPGDKLTPDERKRLAVNIHGYDISPDMVRLSLVNLYLHGFANPRIEEYDTLTSEDKWNEYADIILANPPFMSPKGGIKPHKRFSVPSNRSEVLFVDYMIEHLTSHGRAGIIVPEGIIFQNGKAYRRLREVLVKNSLIGVISLPSGVFQPYSGVKTSILILDKRIAKSRPTILFSDVRAIGISLGIKRTVTERNDLPHVLKDFTAYYSEKPLSQHSWHVERSTVLSNDCNLSGERYRPVEVRAGTRVVTLKEVCSITKGTHSSTKTEPGPYPLIVTARKWLTSSDYQMEGETVCVPLISSSGHGRASINRIHFASGKFAVANLLAAIQPKDLDILSTKFLYLVLDLQKDKMSKLMKGAANVSMKVDDLAEFQIPLPPLEIQKEIVAELEGYQKVIDGARSVIDNYRPHIPIHPEWPMVELDKVCVINPESINPELVFPKQNIFYVDISSVENETGRFLGYTEVNTSDAPSRARRSIKTNDVLLSTVRPNLKAFTLLRDICDRAVASTGFAVLRSKKEYILPGFLIESVRSKDAVAQMIGMMGRGAYPSINQSDVASIKIPLPPLATQQAIVAEIEAEQALVAANRELITRFEKKIQTAIGRIWGDEGIQGH